MKNIIWRIIDIWVMAWMFFMLFSLGSIMAIPICCWIEYGTNVGIILSILIYVPAILHAFENKIRA